MLERKEWNEMNGTEQNGVMPKEGREGKGEDVNAAEEKTAQLGRGG